MAEYWYMNFKEKKVLTQYSDTDMKFSDSGPGYYSNFCGVSPSFSYSISVYFSEVLTH
jgi:hypothetical protein